MSAKKEIELSAVRTLCAGLQTQFASAAAVYDGPTKTLFEEVQTKLATVLAGLPKDGEGGWQLAENLDWLFDCLNGATGALNALTLELTRVKTSASAAPVADTLAGALAAGTHFSKADLDTHAGAAVTAAIAKRTAEDGDLVTRATVTQLCSAAQATGVKDGRAELQAELAAQAAATTLVTDRTTALTAAGLPLPDTDCEAILRAADAEFTTARALVETRRTAFTEAGIELTPELLARLWDGEKEFNKFSRLVNGIPALKRKGAPAPEPLAGGPGVPGTAGKRMVG